MKKIKGIIVVFILVFTISTMLQDCGEKVFTAVSGKRGPIKVAAFLYDFNDDLISAIRKNLEDIQKENNNKVEYVFYDSKSDESIQNQNIDKVLNEGTDLILLNLVNRNNAQAIINKIKDTNIPVLLFNREPTTPVPMQSYNRSLFIGTDPKQAGTLQGKMLIDAWNSSKEFIDKNKNNKMEYVMLQGERDNIEAIERTRYSVSTIEGAGINTQRLAIEVCNWREDLAYEAIKKLLSIHGNEIEVIIANDDTMAIGAIKALQEFGYNKGDKTKTVLVVGVDITPMAKELIEKGDMLGSVSQNPREYAEALYNCGLNLVNKRNPIYGTRYQLDETGVAVRIPQIEYMYKNIFS
ncbi:galactose ABC transporter substrate-binding protein [Clostridium cibarium]|uniref:D-galactose/methyl-galactoside binding periplasmic protein MglB n=1 Tax=Clostridium cibarium TaxID=2762247 RepID=A0ABR8PVQ8_9CLOT|nr:galactose ABC transporter substrate-binding protein [Clostridium cibarium]MBD7912218.1 galactose ABC transporter substrate-binding protein [Clostridium cibarium]